jgi:hypothetical protein
VDLRLELVERTGACGSEAGATRKRGSTATTTSSYATSMEHGQILELLHAAVTHAWRSRHDLLPLAQLVQQHWVLHDDTDRI